MWFVRGKLGISKIQTVVFTKPESQNSLPFHHLKLTFHSYYPTHILNICTYVNIIIYLVVNYKEVYIFINIFAWKFCVLRRRYIFQNRSSSHSAVQNGSRSKKYRQHTFWPQENEGRRGPKERREKKTTTAKESEITILALAEFLTRNWK